MEEIQRDEREQTRKGGLKTDKKDVHIRKGKNEKMQGAKTEMKINHFNLSQ